MIPAITENASPYYVRFEHDGIPDIIGICRQHMPDVQDPGLYQRVDQHPGFCHYRLPQAVGQRILSLVPFSGILPFQEDRVSLFITQPGYYYRAHKDGLSNRISINYPIMVQDQLCETRWYRDQDLAHYPIDNLSTQTSRECQGFDPAQHRPAKTMTAQVGEGILFNTNIFHDFDNSQSTHHRVVLTLRLRPPLCTEINFKQARSMIFPDLPTGNK